MLTHSKPRLYAEESRRNFSAHPFVACEPLLLLEAHQTSSCAGRAGMLAANRSRRLLLLKDLSRRCSVAMY
jgi:hypothetical protein